jgi:EAL domain-containing protein (putative c-di-GMP-specific phosphodiesterase class I)
LSDGSSHTADELNRDRAIVARALDGRVTAAYQPIVDLGRNQVVGFEALLRYRGDHASSAPAFSAGALLASAHRIGRTAELESVALSEALSARESLPRGSSLFLNISVAALADDRATEVLRSQGALEGVVLELHDGDVTSLSDVCSSLQTLRDRGASVAIADPTLKPESLELLMRLEPGYLKLDRRLVSGVSGSRSKLAVIDSLRHLAHSLDMSVIAQGIEQMADLRSLERLGITFGQGYLLARPADAGHLFSTISALDATKVAAIEGDERLTRLIEPVCELTEEDLDSPLPTSGDIGFEVIVTELREPLALLRRAGSRVLNLPMTLVAEGATVREAARIAMCRPTSARFEPLVCVDELGACVGVVRVDRLVESLMRARGEVRPSVHAGDHGRLSRVTRHRR